MLRLSFEEHQCGQKKTHPIIFNDVEFGLSFIRETLFFTCFPLPSDMKRNPVLLVKKKIHIER